MADLERRCAVQNLTITINVRIDFRQVNNVVTQIISDFGAKNALWPYCLTSYALPAQLPIQAQGSLPVVWLAPYWMGFPPIKYHTLAGRTDIS